MLQRDFLHNNQICYRGTSYIITRYVTEGTLTQKPACHRGNSYTETSMLQRELLHRNQHVTERTLTQNISCHKGNAYRETIMLQREIIISEVNFSENIMYLGDIL